MRSQAAPGRRFLAVLTPGVLVLASLLCGPAAAQGLVELFEGPTASWRLPANPGGAEVISQQRVRARLSGQEVGAEQVRFRCPAGYSGVFLYPIGKAPVLEESKLSVVYRGSATGARLAARVVFPRTESPTGDGPLTTVVRGEDRYETPGQWGALSVEDLPLLVQRRARLLRSELAATTIDERGAYVDSVVLIVPGGPGGSEFWVERLTVEGAVELAGAALEASEANVAPAAAVNDVRVTSNGFADGQEPYFPRVWSSQGEAVEAIRQFGFNTVAMNAPADAALRAEAAEHSLRLISPPPQAFGGEQDLGVDLAWLLPMAVDSHSMDSSRPQITRVRHDPLLSKRPVLAAPRVGFAAWSRMVDVLLVPAGEGIGPADAFATALGVSAPGTPALARIRADYSPASRDQFRAFAPKGKARTWRNSEALERDTWHAVAAGAKGVWLEADTPLGGGEEEARAAAAAIELLNLKLALIEPWLVGGETVGPLLDANRRPVATIFRRGRTRLVVGYAESDPRQTELVVPAVSETAAAFRLTPAGLAPLDRKRTLGGVAIAAQAFAPGEFVLLTDDRRTLRSIQTRGATTARRAVELQQALMIDELSTFEATLGGAATQDQTQAFAGLDAAVKRRVSRSKAATASGDPLGAYFAASEGRALLASARADYASRMETPSVFDSSPLARVTATWSDELRLRQLLRALPRSGNVLAGGDFEDLAAVRSAGWSHTQLDGAARSTVELSSADPIHGEHCLVLRGSPEAAPSVAPSAWVTSPGTTLAAGQLIEITGWVKFDPEGDAPGALAIVDSLGGEELAVVVREGADWTRFRLLRRPTKKETLRVTFALTGAGAAAIDAVMIRPISFETAKLKTAAEQQSTPPAGYKK